MAQKITINNFNAANLGEQDELQSMAHSGDSTLSLVNTQGFAQNSLVIIGTLGADDSELVIIDSVDSNTGLTLTAALQHSYNQFTKVTQLFGNTFKIYRAADTTGQQPADSEFTLLQQVPMDLDQPETTYVDSDGGDGFWYKATQFNSYNNSETDLAESPAVLGGTKHNYCSVEDIRKEAGLQNNHRISDWDISLQRQYVQGLIDAELVGLYTVPFTAPVSAVIAGITWQWSAGLLLLRSYGNITALNTNNGQAKIDAAKATLDKVKDRTYLLTDAAGIPTVLSNSGGGLEMWPNPTTAFTEGKDGGGNRMFRVSDRY